jgi:hypothetical protein
MDVYNMSAISLESVKKNRNMPFLKRGLSVEIDGKMGSITSGNSSGNINVRLDGKNYSENFHPKWKTKYFDKDNNIIADYTIEPNNGKSNEMTQEEKYFEDKEIFLLEEIEQRIKKLNGEIFIQENKDFVNAQTNFCLYYFKRTAENQYKVAMLYYR